MSNPYMLAAKKAVRQFIDKPWLEGWMWKIEIDAEGAPVDFDLYVKDANFSAGSMEVENVKIAGGEIVLPASSSAGEITLTVRDDQNLTIDKFMDERLAKVKNKDGTFNIPVDYLFHVTFYALNEAGEPTLYRKYRVYPTKKGDITLSRESGNVVHSFPLILQKFSTVGTKVL